MSQVFVLKATGERELFDESKLFNSLTNAGATEEQAKSVVGHLVAEIFDGMTTNDIYRHAFDLLRTAPQAPRQVAVRYSMRRALGELGPNGFPFEQFVAEIFRAKGYEAVTDQIVQGACVEHEMDVVAWKDKELIMIEAKFHNEPGLKSDIKVALYVKARFDDLKGQTFEYGGKKRKLTAAYLFTNTKFTDHAIRYAECQKLSLVGWDYPKGGSLQELIEETRLHPVTAIPGITEGEKKTLLAQGVVLCKSVREAGDKLTQYGIDKDRVGPILDDAKHICA
jgi:hypothetical protein